MAVFISGTGTNVGKTLFCTLWMAKYGLQKKIQYWKPVETGSIEESDFHSLKNSLPLKDSYFIKPVYRFSYPASPHYSAILENKKIELEDLERNFQLYKNSPVMMEGAGGLMTPLTREVLYIDFLKKFHIPILLVCHSGLGTINHTLMSIEILRNRHFPILGFYFTGERDHLSENNAKTIEEISQIPFLGQCIVPEKIISKENLEAYSRENFDPERKLENLF